MGWKARKIRKVQEISPQIPIYWAKPSIPHSTMKEHPDIVKFCHFSAYVRTRSAGILRGLTSWHTDFGTKSSVLHLVRGVQAPGTHVRSDLPEAHPIQPFPPRRAHYTLQTAGMKVS